VPGPQRSSYNNLMTAADKQWLIKIQLKQLQTENPYLDDFYYHVSNLVHLSIPLGGGRPPFHLVPSPSSPSSFSSSSSRPPSLLPLPFVAVVLLLLPLPPLSSIIPPYSSLFLPIPPLPHARCLLTWTTSDTVMASCSLVAQTLADYVLRIAPVPDATGADIHATEATDCPAGRCR